MTAPKIIDDDAGEISADLNGEKIRTWIYRGDSARIQKMREAREFAEGWFAATNRLGVHATQSSLAEAWRP